MVNVVSFGFRRGAPADADLLFDVRFPPESAFRDRAAAVDRQKPARLAVRAADAGGGAVPEADHCPDSSSWCRNTSRKGKTYLTIAIGCTGGRHRSVAIAENIAGRLRRMRGLQVRVRHRDVEER
jgi:UPF0042 nucleotide-binding protein